MYDIRWIRENEAQFEAGRARRGLPPLAQTLFEFDDARRAAIAKLQTAQERRNAASKEIGQAMKEKNAARADELKAEVARIKEDFPKWEEEERAAVKALEEALAKEPNTPLRRSAGGQGRARQRRDARRRRQAEDGLSAEGAFRHRRGAGPDGLRNCDEDFRLALRDPEGSRWRAWSAR